MGQRSTTKQSVIDVSSPPRASSASKSHFASNPQSQKKSRKSKLWEPKVDPAANLEMDVAIVDFIHSKQYNFKAAEDPKFKRVINIARRLPPTYEPPSAYHLGGTVLYRLYEALEEEWEKVPIGPNGDDMLEARLVRKYGGLRWLDQDNGYRVCETHANRMFFQKGGAKTNS